MQATHRAARGHDAFGIERILDRHRDTMQRSSRAAFGEQLVGLPGFPQRALEAAMDHGVQPGVHGLDAGDGRAHSLDSGELFVPDPARQRRRRDRGELIGSSQRLSREQQQ